MRTVVTIEQFDEKDRTVLKECSANTEITVSWHGHTKNGLLHVAVPSISMALPAGHRQMGTFDLEQRHLEQLLVVIAERQVGRQAMTDALRRQRLKVTSEAWTDADEAKLLQDFD